MEKFINYVWNMLLNLYKYFRIFVICPLIFLAAKAQLNTCTCDCVCLSVRLQN